MEKWIDADALANWLNSYHVANNQTWYALYQDTLRHISDMPAADVAPVRHGKWITTRTQEHDGEMYCSQCDCDAPTEGDYRQVKTNFCPNCGALMDESP